MTESDNINSYYYYTTTMTSPTTPSLLHVFHNGRGLGTPSQVTFHVSKTSRRVFYLVLYILGHPAHKSRERKVV